MTTDNKEGTAGGTRGVAPAVRMAHQVVQADVRPAALVGKPGMEDARGEPNQHGDISAVPFFQIGVNDFNDDEAGEWVLG